MRDNNKKQCIFDENCQKRNHTKQRLLLLEFNSYQKKNDRDKTNLLLLLYYSTTKTDFLSYCNKIVGLVKIYVSKLLHFLLSFSRNIHTHDHPSIL